MAALWAFVGVAALTITTPGPDTALTVRNALLGGRRCGIATALGVSMGLAVWTVAASAGIAALLVASEPAFMAVKLAGAAHPLYLGATSPWDALRGCAARVYAGRSTRSWAGPSSRSGCGSRRSGAEVAAPARPATLQGCGLRSG